MSPSAGATVTGNTIVTVASDAPYVAIEAIDNIGLSITTIRPVAGGTATWSWPTYGFSVLTRLVTYPCETADPSSCLPWAATSVEQLTAENPVDGFTAPASPLFHVPGVDAPIRVTVTDDAPGTLFVGHSGYAGLQAVTRNQSVEFSFADPAYNAGDIVGSFVAIRCSPVNPQVCSAASEPSAEVIVRRHIFGSLHTAESFSPNGDGRFDVLQVAMTSEYDIADLQASWTLVDASGASLLSPKPIDLSAPTGDSVSFTVDPAAVGLSLAHGTHTLRVNFTGTDHGRAFTGVAAAEVLVDVTGPAITSLIIDHDVFYPVRDDGPKQYLNVVHVNADFGEPVDSGRVDILDATGAVVARDLQGDWANGRFKWEGEDLSGRRIVPEGVYRFKIAARDQLGTAEVGFSSPFTVSHGAYTRRTWKKQVTAKSTLFKDWSGRCGLLKMPGLRGGPGSIGYYSEAKCRTPSVEAGVAEALHRVKVPHGDVYKTLTIRAYGGPVDPGNRVGMIGFANTGEIIGSTRALSADWGWHDGVRASAAAMVYGDRSVYWNVACGFHQRYDITKFALELDFIEWDGPTGSHPARTPRLGDVGSQPRPLGVRPLGFARPLPR
jgi:hypothetical protein